MNFQKYKTGENSAPGSTATIRADTLIAGAGAAGLFAALRLAQQGLKVIILERGAQPGRKLTISGGGHANFSNLNMSIDKFLAPPDNKFCAAALSAWTPQNMVDFIQKAGFSVVEKDHGRLFLLEGAPELLKFLLRECQKRSVQIYLNTSLQKLNCRDDHFLAQAGPLRYKAAKVILALGSPARPKLAGTDLCWRVASELGHRVFPPKAALTPLRYTKQTQIPLGALAGISVKVKLSIKDDLDPAVQRSWQDDLLFTHKGLSGPVILCASLYYRTRSRLEIDFLPQLNFEKVLDANEKSLPNTLLRGLLPARLVKALLPSDLITRKAGQLSRKERNYLGRQINAWQIEGLKAAGLESAEVCAGGVDLEQIEAGTMESRVHPNLYICGEMLNVTGELGGYNLHWAWASAQLASLAIAEKV